MKVQNMVNSRGNKVANQFIITVSDESPTMVAAVPGRYFQSYDTMIAFMPDFRNRDGLNKVLLDAKAWDYSTTTGRYRNQFLGETKRETQAKIDSGEYKLVDLN